MTASVRRVQQDRRSARWRSCLANRRCTTPTRETVASQRIGPWHNSNMYERWSAASALHAPCSSVHFVSTTARTQAWNRFMCPLMRSERDKWTNWDTRSFTWSKDLDCIIDTRWTSQLAWRYNQPGPRSRHNSLSAFMLAASLSLVAILTLSSCSHASLGPHDTSRSAFSRISEVQDSSMNVLQ